MEVGILASVALVTVGLEVIDITTKAGDRFRSKLTSGLIIQPRFVVRTYSIKVRVAVISAVEDVSVDGCTTSGDALSACNALKRGKLLGPLILSRTNRAVGPSDLIDRKGGIAKPCVEVRSLEHCSTEGHQRI